MDRDILTVTTDSFSMRYFRFGKGKTPLVIIPGVSIRSVMESAAAVRYAYSRFEDAFDIYLFDRINDIPEGYTVEAMGEDTAAAMEKLGLQDCCFIGVSQGGMIAQVIAGRHPGLVKRLVLAATACADNEMSQQVFDTVIRLCADGASRELNILMAERIYSPAFFEKYRSVFEDTAAAITREDLVRFSRMTARMRDFDFREELCSIKCSTLVMGGSEDRIFGIGASEELARRLGCDLYIFEGLGHAFYDEADDFKERLYSFFTQK